MEIKNLESHELTRLHQIAKKHLRKAILYPFFIILFITIFCSIPLKYLPKRLSSRNAPTSPEFYEETIASFVGQQNFILGVIILAIIFALLSLATYKNISIKKDLRDKRKKIVEGIVTIVDQYEGKPYVRLKKGTGINIIHFDQSNYIPLKIGDRILFEVYEHSNILIKVLGELSKIKKESDFKKPIKPIEVTDKCPACKHQLSTNDLQCPDCGLNFS